MELWQKLERKKSYFRVVNAGLQGHNNRYVLGTCLVFPNPGETFDRLLLKKV